MRCPSCGLTARHVPSVAQQAQWLWESYLDGVFRLLRWASRPCAIYVIVVGGAGVAGYLAHPPYSISAAPEPVVWALWSAIWPGLVLLLHLAASRWPTAMRKALSFLTGAVAVWLITSLVRYNEGRRANTWGTADRTTDRLVQSVPSPAGTAPPSAAPSAGGRVACAACTRDMVRCTRCSAHGCRNDYCRAVVHHHGRCSRCGGYDLRP